MSKTAEIGRSAEELASRYLKDNGFHILHRNWRHGRYELDIVARKDGMLHIVEVKCRHREGLTTPEEALSHKKSSNLLKAAELYVGQNDTLSEIQIDLIAVEYTDASAEIRYYPDVIHPVW